MSDSSPLIPLAAAAARMETTPLNVLMHIKRGLLAGEEHDGVWYVRDDSLERFLAQDLRPGAQAVCATAHCGRGCGSSGCG